MREVFPDFATRSPSAISYSHVLVCDAFISISYIYIYCIYKVYIYIYVYQSFFYICLGGFLESSPYLAPLFVLHISVYSAPDLETIIPSTCFILVL